MGKPAIRVGGLGKRYRIRARKATYHTLRERLADAFSRPFRSAWLRRGHGANVEREDVVWALKDVFFEVAQGEVLGVIGRNGAGKSTLLKILSRITEPTEGCVELVGRVGSLLEVGTGFHSELTGRENIYLNGAILGMKKAEIERKFDEMVAFAGVERFIDTPIKHYSSGMHLRLGFAVAAHLEPEILLVDEVLAVGDAEFQKKCIGKMGEVAKEGRTVVFVSHQMAAVGALCTRCLLFDGGKLVASGPAGQVVGQYLSTTLPAPVREMDLDHHPGRKARSYPLMRKASLWFGTEHLEEKSYLPLGDDLNLTVHYTANDIMAYPVLGLVIKNSLGVRVIGLNNKFAGAYPKGKPAASGSITCRLTACPLVEGRYSMDLWFGDPYRDYDVIENAISFDVVAGDQFGTGLVPGQDIGVIVWPARWEFDTGEVT